MLARCRRFRQPFSFIPMEQTYITFVEVLYGLILVLCFTVGTIGNTTACNFFVAEYKSHSALIYIFITINDAIISVLALPMALSYLSMRRESVLFGKEIMCDLYGVFWNITSRFGIYLVAVLSIIRTYTLYYPFRRINKTILLLCNISYVLLLIAQALVPYTESVHYTFFQKYVQCFVLLGDLYTRNSFRFILTYVILILLEYIFPIIPIIVSCGISTWLIQRETVQPQNQAISTQRRSATITIIMFTLVYIILNIPAVSYELVGAVEMYTSGNNSFAWDSPYQYFRNMISAISIVINATVNPCLYLLRMNSFRRTTKSRISRITNLVTISLSERRRSTDSVSQQQ